MYVELLKGRLAAAAASGGGANGCPNGPPDQPGKCAPKSKPLTTISIGEELSDDSDGEQGAEQPVIKPAKQHDR